MRVEINGATLELAQGDITQQQVDAIVNAANASLAGGGGVDGAIHRAGGPAIKAETDNRYPDGCPTGSAVPSTAGDLPARYVLHAVGPRYRDGNQGEAELLGGAYRRSLELAVEHDCDSVAFPAISMGAYGYPPEEASRVALTTVADYLRQHGKPSLVRFVLFDDKTHQVFEKSLQDIDAS